MDVEVKAAHKRPQWTPEREAYHPRPWTFQETTVPTYYDVMDANGLHIAQVHTRGIAKAIVDAVNWI